MKLKMTEYQANDMRDELALPESGRNYLKREEILGPLTSKELDSRLKQQTGSRDFNGSAVPVPVPNLQQMNTSNAFSKHQQLSAPVYQQFQPQHQNQPQFQQIPFQPQFQQIFQQQIPFQQQPQPNFQLQPQPNFQFPSQMQSQQTSQYMRPQYQQPIYPVPQQQQQQQQQIPVYAQQQPQQQFQQQDFIKLQQDFARLQETIQRQQENINALTSSSAKLRK
jgi:hypothetical protein